MPKYILSPDGSIKNRDDHAQEVDITDLSKEKVVKAGSFYNKHKVKEDFLTAGAVKEYIVPHVNLDAEDSTPHIIDKEDASVGDDKFVFGTRGDKFLANPSFGGDIPVEYYRNFNNYLSTNVNDQKVFAKELEMISGTAFGSDAAGFSDLTKYTIWIDYIIEAAAYIGVIETILGAEKFFIDLIASVGDTKSTHQIEQDFQMELGNYGPVNYSALTRYIHEVLRYPKNKDSRPGLMGTLERLGAFYVGFSFFVNTDPKIFFSKFGWAETSKQKTITGDLGFSPLSEIVFYLLDGVASLSNIGNNRLLMLIRRFNQKADWHNNKLFKAKEDDQDNSAERFLVELNYYYVTFIIERMHVGLKLKKYYSRKGTTRNKLKRSSRFKTSDREFVNPQKSTRNNVIKNDIKYADLAPKSIEKAKAGYINKMQNKSDLSISALPQAFIMPASMIYSMNMTSDTNVIKEAFVEEHVANYFIRTEGQQKRISPKTVAALEDYYEQEMMPFYFQDIRTNEIIGFHAFIDAYSDSFTPQYNETSPGYGRVDKVQHYVNTARSITVDFTLAAMSKEDHDLMWYQINKLVSMVYPQWSDGYKNKQIADRAEVIDALKSAQYPFTQVPIASPLIRIRLGDVLKSNYTTHAIEKIHGLGTSPANRTTEFESRQPDDHVQCYLLPGTYKDEKGEIVVLEELKAVTIISESAGGKVLTVGNIDTRQFDRDIAGAMAGGGIGAMAGVLAAYKANGDTGDQIAGAALGAGVGVAAGVGIAGLFDKTKIYEVDSKSVVTYTKFHNMDVRTGGGGNKGEFSSYTKAYIKSRRIEKVNNPITAAQETTLGKGLAGFIKSLSMNTQDQLWETSVRGSKAPITVKFNLTFEPIHDIAPGLDADGAMRAPVYNTGRIINNMYGDVYNRNNVVDREGSPTSQQTSALSSPTSDAVTQAIAGESTTASGTYNA